MGSKVFIFLGLLFALHLLISSEVTANDEKKQEKTTNVNGVNDAKYGGGGYPGGGYPGGGYPGGGYPGGGYPGGGYPGGGYPGGGRGNPGRGYCRHGCCDRHGSYGSGCRNCCRYAGEAAHATTEVKPHN